jgi:hypothetical protein
MRPRTSMHGNALILMSAETAMDPLLLRARAALITAGLLPTIDATMSLITTHSPVLTK